MHTFLSCQCELFILSCFPVSEYISGNSSEKLTKLAFRPQPHNGFVLLHSPRSYGLITLGEIAHAGGGHKNRDTLQCNFVQCDSFISVNENYTKIKKSILFIEI